MARACCILALGLAIFFVLPACAAFAHDLAVDQVLLIPNPRHHELRGQVTFNPHRTRGLGDAITPRVEARVLAAIGEAFEVTLDGKPLKLELSVRELWVRAGPTVGDIILVSARLPSGSGELRVRANARRTALAFLFGLVHGQGFASGLIALGLPRRTFLSSLFSFNVGVEAGQLVAVLVVCLALAALRKRTSTLAFAVRYGSIAVGIAGFGLGVWRLLA